MIIFNIKDRIRPLKNNENKQMKKLIYILTVLLAYSGFAQEERTKQVFDNDLRKANIYYNRAYYSKAIPLYEKIIHKNRTKEIVERLATAYFNTGNLKASARLYGYLLNRSKNSNTYENTFKYMQALKASGNYKDAHTAMHDYYVSIGDSLAIDKLKADIKHLENITAIGDRYTLKNLSINTAQSEFGMVAKGDQLVYAAANQDQNNSVLQSFYGWNNEPFLDIYTLHKDSLKVANPNPKSLSKKINTKMHEATVAFNKDANVVYFTRNNFLKNKEVKDDKAITHLQLYKAQLVDSVWTKITALPFNADTYSVEHPALSPDGKRLYFASDMPGGLGEFDLYYVDILSDSTYSAPIHLGPEINTKHREQFPFIAANGDLYFSSNGHLGYGGLDVFLSKKSKGEFEKPDNLGQPLNSGFDDFALYLDTSLKQGYVSSNRTSGVGSDDIYSFTEEKPLIIEDCKQFIKGLITDKDTNQPIANATVTISQEETNAKALLSTHKTVADGKFNAESICEIAIVVEASAPGYKASKRRLNIGSTRKKINDASMQLKSLKAIQKEEEEKQKRIAEKKRQEEQKKLKEKQEQKEKEEQDKEKRKANIIASEPLIKKRGDRIVIETSDIYFDYKLWYIRRDVKRILQPLIRLMKRYPGIHIEIESHTDIRGNKTYNRNLSQKRATSTKEYLVSQGIEASRIEAVGYGESKPIIKCATEDACSEEEHEVNRRSKFTIKKFW